MWLGSFTELPYIKFIDGRFATASLNNQGVAAVADSVNMFMPGIMLDARYDDIPSPWTTIATQQKKLPVLQEAGQQELLAELNALEKQRAQQAGGG